ncbi:MAG: TIR domain-containing protein, partial [Candidatus Omnitrophica bacterium]|nr:TIR domain-containing protein [Candidatus Omnitrophota bacterium]
VEKWIDEQLKGTSVTVVLIGSETSSRKYVTYEVKKSYEEGNGLVGIHIHKQEDKDGKTSKKGEKTFGELGKDENGKSVYFYQVAEIYDYVDDDGYNNMGDWIEEAAKKAGR